MYQCIKLLYPLPVIVRVDIPGVDQRKLRSVNPLSIFSGDKLDLLNGFGKLNSYPRHTTCLAHEQVRTGARPFKAFSV